MFLLVNNIRGVIKNNRSFLFFQKVFIYQKLFVPFEVTPLRYNTLMPAFFPILGVFSFGKRKKSAVEA